MSRNIAVSVVIVSYNQKNYIGRCIESFVNQTTSIKYEILISDDCSTDGSSVVIDEYSKKYPNLIRNISPNKNVGPFVNARRAHLAAIGEYVIHCDGDDFAYEDKIEKLYNLITSAQNINIAAHRMDVIKNGRKCGVTVSNPPQINLEYMLINHPCFLASSIILKKNAYIDLLRTNIEYLDFYLYIYLCGDGGVAFTNDTLGGYESGVGISTSLSHMGKIKEAVTLAESCGAKQIAINKCMSNQCLSYSMAYLFRRDYTKFKEYISEAATYTKDSKLILFLNLVNFPRTAYFILWLYKSLRRIK